MSDRLAVYSAAAVAMNVGGVDIVGLADGEFVTIERRSDSFVLKVGADGEAARAATNDRSGQIKFKLLHTSLSNTYLSQLVQSDEDSINGAGVVTTRIVDLNSGEVLAHANKSWVLKPASISRGKEVGEVEWTLETNAVRVNNAGNPSL